MNHADFDPYLIRERNEGLRREVRRLQLEKRLRANRGEYGSRFVAFARTATRPLLRVMRLAGYRRTRVYPAHTAAGTTSIGCMHTSREE